MAVPHKQLEGRLHYYWNCLIGADSASYCLPRFFLPTNTPLVVFPAFHLCPPILCSVNYMSSSNVLQRWNLFSSDKIYKRYRQQTTQPSLGLRPFFASEMARLSAGCSIDGFGIQPLHNGFHLGWQRDAHARKLTRASGFHIVADIVRVSSQPCRIILT
jgi:hypothetical protein